MDAKTTVEKLQLLLPHWIEHNNHHEAEFRKWADLARAEQSGKLAEALDQAAASMVATDELLRKALSEAGGPAPDLHSHSHHHHHHD
jgi:hypothetical protein